MIKENKTNWWM